uniref:Radical SAM protein n=1 Tax=Ascaris lumbricoides TaxID=6252 RepID=A0A0M3HF33_ASCLU
MTRITQTLRLVDTICRKYSSCNRCVFKTRGTQWSVCDSGDD